MRTALSLEGYEMIDLELRLVDEVLRIDGIWHPSAHATEVHLDLELGEIEAMTVSMAQTGWSLVDIEAYLDLDGFERWATLWTHEALDVTIHEVEPGSSEAAALTALGLQPFDLEVVDLESGGSGVVGLWKPLTDGDWYRSHATWTEILERSDVLAPPSHAGAEIWRPRQFLIDLDIDSTLDGQTVRPQPLDHDGPITPGGR